MRWAKMTKYIPEFGWQPVVYTPRDNEVAVHDESLVKEISTDLEIIKTPIWEPYDLYKSFLGRKKKEKLYSGFINEKKKESLAQKISVFVRGNFFIPDARMFWIKPSVRYLKKYLREHHVDAIISTGPPHSMHMIAEALHKSTGIPWIADFRDPWTNIDFYKDLNLNFVADKIHHHLENRIIKNADCVLVVSKGMKEEYELLKPKEIQVISNGYDDSDILAKELKLDKKFSISHIGTLNAARNPKTVWKVLAEICNENPEFKADLQIQLIGKVDFSVLEDISLLNLDKNLIKIDYISHQEAIAKQYTSQILLLLINQSDNAKGILTGKFFEYLAAKRPILAIGPIDGDAAAVLNETGTGKIIDFNDIINTKKAILYFYNQFRSNTLNIQPKSVERFSRRSLTGELAKLLDTL